MSTKKKRLKSAPTEHDDEHDFGIFEKYRSYGPNVKRVIVGRYGMDVEEYGEDGIVTVLSDRHYKDFDWQLEQNEKEWRKLLSDYGASEWPHIVSKDVPELAKDISLLLRMAKHLRNYIKQGDMRASVYFAYQFGIVFQRWQVRWAERFVRHGRRMQVSGPKARATKMMNVKLRQKWILEKADPMLGNGKKREMIARDISKDAPPQFRLSPGTIERILAKHRPVGGKKTFRRSAQSVGKHE